MEAEGVECREHRDIGEPGGGERECQMETDELQARHEVMPVVVVLDFSVDEEVLVTFESEGEERSDPYLGEWAAE